MNYYIQKCAMFYSYHCYTGGRKQNVMLFLKDEGGKEREKEGEIVSKKETIVKKRDRQVWQGNRGKDRHAGRRSDGGERKRE